MQKRHTCPSPKGISLLFLMICCSLQASAQADTLPAPVNCWGFRIDVSANESHPGTAALAGATFTHGRHQLYAGLILDAFDTRANSVLFGGSFSYQYFPLRARKLLNPYAYATINAGKYTADEAVQFFYPSDTSFVGGATHTSSSITSGLAGIGVEARFGTHCYASFGAGIGVYYQRRTIEGAFSQASDQTPPQKQEDDIIGTAAEVKIGFGYRF